RRSVDSLAGGRLVSPSRHRKPPRPMRRPQSPPEGSRKVRFLDTTFRDGSQSLWAMGMRHGMMEAVASDLDRAGFHVIEVPGNSIHFKKFIRDLRENPWVVMRMLAARMPDTPKSCMGSNF